MPRIPRIPGFKYPNPRNILNANPGNPVSMAGAATKTQTEAQTLMAQAQAASVSSILGGMFDPGAIRHAMFQAAAIIGQMWNIFSYSIQQQESNKQANKDTFPAALAAR